jgi:hypothetical protein
LNIKPDGVCGCTFLAVEDILRDFGRLGPEGSLYCFDQDQDALNTIDDDRFVYK